VTTARARDFHSHDLDLASVLAWRYISARCAKHPQHQPSTNLNLIYWYDSFGVITRLTFGDRALTMHYFRSEASGEWLSERLSTPTIHLPKHLGVDQD